MPKWPVLKWTHFQRLCPFGVVWCGVLRGCLGSYVLLAVRSISPRNKSSAVPDSYLYGEYMYAVVEAETCQLKGFMQG